MNIVDMIKLGLSGYKPSDIKKLEGSGIDSDSIIGLAKNGYSVDDINELITMSKKSEEVQPGNSGQTAPEGPQELPGNKGEDKADKMEQLINEQNAEIEKLKKTLEAAQIQNSRRNLGGAEPKNPREELQTIFKGLY